MKASVSQKRNAMEMCKKLIPLMDEEEIRLIAIVLNKAIERLMKEGRITE